MDVRSNAEDEEVETEVDGKIVGTGIKYFLPSPLTKSVNNYKY